MEKYDYDPYANGLLKSIDQTLLICSNEIAKIKATPNIYNETASIMNSGRKAAFGHIMGKLNGRKKNIIAKAEKTKNA